jgi:predicted nucleic acid-binding protein
MYLVDTNIFLEVLLQGPRKDECTGFLNLLKDGKKGGIITDFAVHSIIVIMGNHNKFKELKIFLTSLTAYKGLHVYNTSLADEIFATEIATEQKMDMDDALQYSIAQAIKAEAIMSFDKHFNNLKIPRMEPNQTQKPIKKKK